MFGSIWIYLQTEVYSTTKYGYSVRQDWQYFQSWKVFQPPQFEGVAKKRVY
jgi:hypothetical protein